VAAELGSEAREDKGRKGPLLQSAEVVLSHPSSVLWSLAACAAAVAFKTAHVFQGHEREVLDALVHVKTTVWASLYSEVHPFYVTAKHILCRGWHWYERGERMHPWQFSIAVTGLTYLMADNISQTYGGRKFDLSRLVHNLLVGGLVLGPFMHSYYMLQDELLAPLNSFAALPLLKIALDQTVYASAYNCIYLSCIDLLKGMPLADIKADVAKNNVPMLKAGWKLWPMVHTLTYTVIPKEHKQLWVCMVEVVWASYLSFVANEKRSETMEVIEAFAGSGGSSSPSATAEKERDMQTADGEDMAAVEADTSSAHVAGPVLTALDAQAAKLAEKAAALSEVTDDGIVGPTDLPEGAGNGSVGADSAREQLEKAVAIPNALGETQSGSFQSMELEVPEAETVGKALVTTADAVQEDSQLGSMLSIEHAETDEGSAAEQGEVEQGPAEEKVIVSGVENAPTFAMTKAVEIESDTQAAVGKVLGEMIDSCPDVEIPEPLAAQLKEMTESGCVSDMSEEEMPAHENRAEVAERMDKVATNLSGIIVEITTDDVNHAPEEKEGPSEAMDNDSVGGVSVEGETEVFGETLELQTSSDETLAAIDK